MLLDEQLLERLNRFDAQSKVRRFQTIFRVEKEERREILRAANLFE